jgi:hypothetical protein
VRQKLWRDGQTFLLALCDSFTQAGGIPIDNYGRKQIETGHAVVLALGCSVPDFPLPADPERIF